MKEGRLVWDDRKLEAYAGEAGAAYRNSKADANQFIEANIH